MNAKIHTVLLSTAIVALLLTACATPPSTGDVQTAIVQTQSAATASPTPMAYQTIQTSDALTFAAQTGLPSATLPAATQTVAFTPTVTLPATNTPTQLPAATATNTPQAPVIDDTVQTIASCGAVIVGQPYVSKYYENDDDGNGSTWTLWLAGQGFTNTTNYQLSLLPPMASLDLESAEIMSSGVKFTGTREQAECVATAYLKVKNVSAYLYTPDTNGFGTGWNNTISPTWKGKPFLYQEAKIETGGIWSADMPFVYGQQKLCAPTGSNANAQMYDPKMEWNDKTTPRPAYHPAIAGDFCLNTPSMQGTWWTNTGADWNKLVDRWNQTHREVDLRDDHPKIFVFWCGKPEDVPVGYSTELPAGFTCTKAP